MSDPYQPLHESVSEQAAAADAVSEVQASAAEILSADGTDTDFAIDIVTKGDAKPHQYARWKRLQTVQDYEDKPTRFVQLSTRIAKETADTIYLLYKLSQSAAADYKEASTPMTARQNHASLHRAPVIVASVYQRSQDQQPSDSWASAPRPEIHGHSLPATVQGSLYDITRVPGSLGVSRNKLWDVAHGYVWKKRRLNTQPDMAIWTRGPKKEDIQLSPLGEDISVEDNPVVIRSTGGFRLPDSP
jgi:hypothetical protein